MTFADSERPKVMAKHPELASKAAEVAKLIGEAWKKLSDGEKAKWNEKAAAHKAEYEAKYGPVVRKTKEGKAGKAKAAKDPNAPKRKPTGYIKFSSSVRDSIIAANPHVKGKITEVAKLVGEAWKKLSDGEKAKWNEK